MSTVQYLAISSNGEMSVISAGEVDQDFLRELYEDAGDLVRVNADGGFESATIVETAGEGEEENEYSIEAWAPV